MNFQEIIKIIYMDNQSFQPVNNVAWWHLIMKSVEEQLNMTEEDQSVWPDLQKVIMKVLNFWLKKYKKWEISSLNMLTEKISKLPGGILATSFCTTMSENFIQLWNNCVSMEDLDETECSDFLSSQGTSTSSTTAPSAVDIAAMFGEGKLNHLEALDLLAAKTSPSTSSQKSTGMMSSSISFLRNGELVKYGLEEKVGKRRLTVRLLLFYIKFYNIIWVFTVELVRWEEEFRTRGQMVRSKNSGSDSECERSENNRTRRATSPAIADEIYGKKSKIGGKYAYIKSKTKALLLKYYCSPVSSVRDVKEFRNDDILSNPKNKDYLQSAFDDFGKDRNDMYLRDIKNILFDESCKPIFIKSMPYGNLEESISIIDELLNYQFNEDEEDICHFLTSVVDIIDKRLTKCNALAVISPPNAGKNFFFDMIFALCLNYGQLGQANRYNVFAFQEAPNKRVLLWNEPNYEAVLTDTIKMMMGGDPYTVRVKNQMDTHVSRTPVIILTNTEVSFLNEPAFNTRIVKFRWKSAELLKNIEFKPLPICLFHILDKYNIHY